MSKFIALLPTGEWAEVESKDDVAIVPVNDSHLEFLGNSHISQRMAGELSMCKTEAEVNHLVEGWNS